MEMLKSGNPLIPLETKDIPRDESGMPIFDDSIAADEQTCEELVSQLCTHAKESV